MRVLYFAPPPLTGYWSFCMRNACALPFIFSFNYGDEIVLENRGRDLDNFCPNICQKFVKDLPKACPPPCPFCIFLCNRAAVPHPLPHLIPGLRPAYCTPAPCPFCMWPGNRAAVPHHIPDLRGGLRCPLFSPLYLVLIQPVPRLSPAILARQRSPAHASAHHARQLFNLIINFRVIFGIAGVPRSSRCLTPF